jgi:hypothetical protein
MTKRHSGPCECSDPGCPVHSGKEDCSNKGKRFVYRVDMEDETGTFMCSRCADDCYESGVFR